MGDLRKGEEDLQKPSLRSGKKFSEPEVRSKNSDLLECFQYKYDYIVLGCYMINDYSVN